MPSGSATLKKLVAIVAPSPEEIIADADIKIIFEKKGMFGKTQEGAATLWLIRAGKTYYAFAQVRGPCWAKPKESCKNEWGEITWNEKSVEFNKADIDEAERLLKIRHATENEMPAELKKNRKYAEQLINVLFIINNFRIYQKKKEMRKEYVRSKVTNLPESLTFFAPWVSLDGTLYQTYSEIFGKFHPLH